MRKIEAQHEQAEQQAIILEVDVVDEKQACI